MSPSKRIRKLRVRLTDINGSGSADLLWGQGYEYRYVDLTGGVRPYLLSKVSNGLGKSNEFEYKSSAELMVEAAHARPAVDAHDAVLDPGRRPIRHA